MELKFNDVKGINEEELRKLEEITGYKLSQDIVDFLKKYGGGNSKKASKVYVFDVIHKNGWKTNNYITKIDDTDSIIGIWKDREHLESLKEHFELDDDFVETRYLFPIAELANGSGLYIAIGGIHEKKVYEVDNGDFGILLIANSLSEFIDTIYLYDFDNN